MNRLTALALLIGCSSAPPPSDAEIARAQCAAAVALECAALHDTVCPTYDCVDVAQECARLLGRCAAE